MRHVIRLCCLALLIGGSLPATALQFDWGDFSVSGKTFVTVGAGWRLEERDNDLVYKTNVEGQQNLCAADDCLSFFGDTGPNQRLVDAEGSFSGHLFDNGNLNYDKGDLYTALVKVNSDWGVNWKDWLFKANVVGFFDEINTDFDETHPNTLFQPAETRRSKAIEDRAGNQIKLRSWQIGSTFNAFDRDFFFTIGRTRLRWGESNLTLFNTLDFINPLDASLARQPGFPLKETWSPVELFTLGSDITESTSVEVFYQLNWRPTVPEPSGTFFSSIDALGGGDNAQLTLGQFPEDLDSRYVSSGTLSLFSNSHRTVFMPNEKKFGARDGGQYGISVRTFLPDILNGTELGFYYANVHSRLPYLSFIASQDSCARDSAGLLEAIDDCNGFNAGAHPDTAERCDPRGCDLQAYLAREPLPVDTTRAFQDFPEDLEVYGISFNFTEFGWSWAGEYAYRPNMPLQVHITDLLFTAVQPGLPSNELTIADPAGLLDPAALLGTITDPSAIPRVLTLLTDLVAAGVIGPDALNFAIPAAHQVAPSFINRYRGIDRIRPGQYVQGYEQFKVHQFTLTALKVLVENPVGSENVIFGLEFGATYIQDLPSIDDGLVLQGSANFTHPAPGADGTGLAPGQSPYFTFNPTQQTRGFGEDFAYGMRTLIQLDYPNIFNSGINLKPTLIGFYDIDGIAPFPIQNYVEDSLWLIPGVYVEYGENITGSVIFQIFDGDDNQLRDRDSVAMEVTYSF